MIRTIEENKLYILKKIYEQGDYILDMSLAEWNLNQLRLWKKLVELNYVEEEDWTIFSKFAKFMRDFVNQKDYFPTVQEVIRHIKVFTESGFNPFLRYMEITLSEDSARLLLIWKFLGDAMGYVDSNNYGIEYKRFVNLCRDYEKRHGEIVSLEWVVDHIDSIVQDDAGTENRSELKFA